MKLYVWDHGWAGAHVVMAASRDEAARMINDELDVKRNLTELAAALQEFKYGEVATTLGDQ